MRLIKRACRQWQGQLDTVVVIVSTALVVIVAIFVGDSTMVDGVINVSLSLYPYRMAKTL